MKEQEIKELEEAARQLGQDAGEAAASWVFDGNTTREQYVRILKGIDDGDPEILDSLPTPNLSGEWADDPTPRSVLEELGVDPEDDALAPDLLSIWEQAASDAVVWELERIARMQLGIPTPDPLAEARDDDYRLPSHAWPGGYPLFYLDSDGNTLCPDCTNSESDPPAIASDVHWEGPALTCADCGREIESAYGDPEDAS